MKVFIKDKKIISDFSKFNSYDIEKDIEINEKETTVIVGNFDAIHKGHFSLISEAKKLGKKIVIYTFYNHKYKSGKSITTISEKLEYIKELGIDYVVISDFFDIENISAKNFVIDILKNKLHMKNIFCGINFRFGKNKQGTVSYLKELEKAYSFKVYTTKPVLFKENIKDINFKSSDDMNLFESGYNLLSSSIIKEYIANANIEDVNLLLNRSYIIMGEVVNGKKLGRLLGFPTANLETKNKLYPKVGVYGSRIYIQGINKPYYGVTNIGFNPTVDNNETIRVETHILDFNKDIYGKIIKIELLVYLRGEKKFNSLDELKSVISDDIKKFRGIINGI